MVTEKRSCVIRNNTSIDVKIAQYYFGFLDVWSICFAISLGIECCWMIWHIIEFVDERRQPLVWVGFSEGFIQPNSFNNTKSLRLLNICSCFHSIPVINMITGATRFIVQQTFDASDEVLLLTIHRNGEEKVYGPHTNFAATKTHTLFVCFSIEWPLFFQTIKFLANTTQKETWKKHTHTQNKNIQFQK